MLPVVEDQQMTRLKLLCSDFPGLRLKKLNFFLLFKAIWGEVVVNKGSGPLCLSKLVSRSFCS